MKMIDVLNMMAKGEIKEETKLIASTVLDDYEYRYSTGYRRFFNKYFNEIEDDFSLDEDFLNLEVKLIPPKPKKYYLRLDEDDDLSYINYNKEEYFCFMITSKYETLKHQSKFTQEEIDGSMFLKFIEQYGVKEEVAEDEDY